MNQPLTALDTGQDVICKLSNGNPGAINVLMQLLRKDSEMWPKLCLLLADMNMYGPAIWIAYQDFAKRDLDILTTSIETRDPLMLDICKSEGCDVRRNGPMEGLL